MNPTPNGGLITGLEVAAASKLLERHPYLRIGAVVGILTSEAERVVEQSTHTITHTMHELADGRGHIDDEWHNELLYRIQAFDQPD